MINGFVIIDKPAGITSHDVVSRVRRILGTKKVGHTGTLDPFATGVLPIAVNGGTKIIPFLDEGSKTYEAVMRLGVSTDTLDMTGTVISEYDISAITKEMFIDAISNFKGSISQIPPMYSAIKQGGQPLYKLARQGLDVERKARPVEIYSLTLISFNLPFVSISVTCSRGTYIRTLAADIGSLLGCGAALQELRRTASGPFTIKNAVTLDDLEKATGEGGGESFFTCQMEALNHLPEIPLTASGFEGLRFGKSPDWSHTFIDVPLKCQEETLVRLSSSGNLVAVACLKPDKSNVSQIILKRVLI